jgi:hypothetical protein
VKPLFEIVIGFVVSLGMFVIGLAAATVLLTAEPARQPGPSVDVADLWTEEPRKVDTTAQDFERLPALQIRSDRNEENPSAETQTAATENAEATDRAVRPPDSITTESLQTAPSGDREQLPQSNQLSAAHVEWCADRYRSYRPDDDSYTSYYGEQRPCISPYSGETVAAEPPSDTESTESYDAELEGDPSSLPWLDGADGNAAVSADHVSYCFSRYRSYRPEDNTYQPYDGGPRRQCR